MKFPRKEKQKEETYEMKSREYKFRLKKSKERTGKTERRE